MAHKLNRRDVAALDGLLTAISLSAIEARSKLGRGEIVRLQNLLDSIETDLTIASGIITENYMIVEA